MIIPEYHGNTRMSVLDRMDPRVKVIGVLAYSVIVALLASMPSITLALIFAGASVFMSGIAWRDFFRRLAAANLFILLLWVFLPFTISGKTAFSLGNVTVSHEGIVYAGLLTLRSNAIILMMMALGASTPVTSIVRALSWMKLPDRLVYLFFFTYRYAHEIVKEYNRVHQAMRIRCFSPGTNMHTYRSYAYLVGILLINGYERGKRVRAAMLCRGFNGTFHSLGTDRFRIHDAAAAAAALCCFIGMVILNVG